MQNRHANPVIEITQLVKSFDDKTVVDKLDVVVNEGEFLTILGPSGCGKTTVLRLIAGFETVDSGSIKIAGNDVSALAPEHRPVNTVFQSYALFPHMSVYDNVNFGLKMSGVEKHQAHERVIEALTMVNLEHLANRKPQQLSGGQQQRVAIARAVVNRPKVLLLDESLSALDYKLRQKMQIELKQLQRKLGITFIFVTHDQEEALSMSDRILVMKDGLIVQDGTPKEVYEDPTSLFVAQFIGQINVFKAQVVKRIDARKVLVLVEGNETNVNFETVCEAGDLVNVLLRPEDLRIEEVSDSHTQGITGTVVERTYKGMTLDSVIELDSGQQIMVSEFFNEDDPDVDHSLGQKVRITWVDNWEVVLPYED